MKRPQNGAKRWCAVCRKVRALLDGRYAPHLIPWTEKPCPMSGKAPRETQSPTTPRRSFSLLTRAR